MSFRDSWKNVERRTFAFHKGTGDDELTDGHLLAQISESIQDVRDALSEKDTPSATLKGFSFCEERIAAMVTSIMVLASRHAWSIPEAMSARNTIIRNAWREKAGLPRSQTVASGVRKRTRDLRN